MPKQPTKSLEDLDQQIYQSTQKQSPEELWRVRQRFSSVLGLVLLVSGLLMFILGILEVRKLSNNWQWPTTSAEIVEVWITRTNILFVKAYCVSPTYSYDVGGDHYEVRSVTSDCNTFRDTVESNGRAYFGRVETIWYDPTYPRDMSNTRVGLERPMTFWAVSGALLAMAVGFLMYALRPPTEKQKAKREYKQPAKPL